MESEQYHLLIVEDDPDILQLLKTTLAFHGYRVDTARNGYEGLAAVQQARPALVVADIMMPKMDGFALVNRLRMNLETCDIPVILVSATYVAPEDRQFAQSIGVTSFIQKPIELEELLHVVAQLLEQGAPPAQEPLQGGEFYEAYRKRLEVKLVQRNAQIARDEDRLRVTLPDAERHAIQAALTRAINERAELELLLAHIEEQRREAR